ncbi:BPSL0067 family protein [Azonexus sp.]|uniref:BPSL0067 family protein n=1 Tax=Azonexus sp. TaxID=1872668 RepID=UPI0035B17822
MAHVLENTDLYRNRSFPNERGNTECVEFIQQTLAAPPTRQWRQGMAIRKLAPGVSDPIRKGTAIATFVGGAYPQQGNTGKHAAIYLGQNADGIQVLDQWRAQGRVQPRTIPWQPRRPGLSNDGNAFSVIEW